MMHRRNVTITEEQDEWIRENHINLSSLVRECIEKQRQESGSTD